MIVLQASWHALFLISLEVVYEVHTAHLWNYPIFKLALSHFDKITCSKIMMWPYKLMSIIMCPVQADEYNNDVPYKPISIIMTRPVQAYEYNNDVSHTSCYVYILTLCLKVLRVNHCLREFTFFTLSFVCMMGPAGECSYLLTIVISE